MSAYNKIVGIGFHKTGTSSIGKLMEQLGLTCAASNMRLIKEIQKNNWDKVWAEADRWDAYQDDPWNILYKEMDQQYPNSKFILTIRDTDKWLKSLLNHFGKNMVSVNWIYGINAPQSHPEILIERYERHTTEVLAYFKDRPEDLLVIDWNNTSDETAISQLCSFLKKDIPSYYYSEGNIVIPRENSAEERATRGKRKIYNRIKKKSKKLMTKYLYASVLDDVRYRKRKLKSLFNRNK